METYLFVINYIITQTYYYWTAIKMTLCVNSHVVLLVVFGVATLANGSNIHTIMWNEFLSVKKIFLFFYPKNYAYFKFKLKNNMNEFVKLFETMFAFEKSTKMCLVGPLENLKTTYFTL